MLAWQIASRLLHPRTLYRSIAGYLQRLTLTRPDLAYAVPQACLPCDAELGEKDAAVVAMVRHSEHPHDHTSMELLTYCDADWAGYPDTGRSTSGYCVFLGDSRVMVLRSKRQDGVANATAECYWKLNLLRELHHQRLRS